MVAPKFMSSSLSPSRLSLSSTRSISISNLVYKKLTSLQLDMFLLMYSRSFAPSSQLNRVRNLTHSKLMLFPQRSSILKYPAIMMYHPN